MFDLPSERLVSRLLAQCIVPDSASERLLLDLLEPRANCASLAPGQLEPRMDKPPSSCNGVDIECLGRPRRYMGSFEFIALSGERNCFDADHQTTNSDTWLGRENLPWNDEVLFLIDGNRWILVYAPGPGHPNESRDDPNRELSPAAAARWLIKNEYELPPSLLPPGMRLDQLNLGTPGQDGPDRLDRNWRPSVPQAGTIPEAADLTAPDQTFPAQERPTPALASAAASARTRGEETRMTPGARAIAAAPDSTPATSVPAQPTTPSPDETSPIASEAQPLSPRTDPIRDEAALVKALRKRKKPKQARLVEFMIEKDAAEFETLAEAVHGHAQTSDDAVEKNARTTSDSAATLGYRVRYEPRSGWVYKEFAAE